jgi:Ca-activated chloride channel family protein
VEEEYRKGIDNMLAMDVSLSMMAMDFEPNRLEAAKKVAKEFVESRVGDRIGLVVYAGEAYTACPGTVDHEALAAQIDSIGNEPIDGGTAIGTGLGTAVARLRDEKLPSKVVILLTDGSNNAGEIDPVSAAELAKEKNVRVYTIGVGTNGEAPTPVITPFGVRFEMAPVEIDERTLTQIAQITDGKYFRATDETSLRSIYEEIDRMEKRKQFKGQFAPEEPATPRPFLLTALILLLISWSIRHYFFTYEL